MIKVGIIVDDIREFGGAEKWVLNVIDLLKENMEFALLTYFDKKRYIRININELAELEDVKIIKFNSTSLPIINEQIPVGIDSIIAFKKIKNFDVIYSTTQNAFTNLFFMSAARFYNKRFIIGLHGSIIFRDFLYSKNPYKNLLLPLYNRIQKAIFFSSKEIHTINYQQKAYLLKNNYKGMIHYIPYFIFANPYSQTFTNINKKINFNHDFFNIIFVGRLSQFDKGLDLLSEIIIKVLSAKNKIKFYIVGSGPGEYVLKNILKDYPNVIFCGFQSGKNLKNIYKNCDLLISTSRYESFGLNILEAQINGVPVISFKTDGASEIIKKPFQGSLIKKYDTKAYAKLINRYYDLIYNGNSSYNYKQLIKRYINKEFNRNKAKKKLLNLFTLFTGAD